MARLVIYPWGTIRSATPDANRATANELSATELEEVRMRAWQDLDVFDYSGFLRWPSFPAVSRQR